MGAGLGPTGWRHRIGEPAPGHRTGAIQQVANRICQVVIDQIGEALLLEVAVVAEGNIPEQIPTHRIATAFIQQLLGVEHIADGLAHLLAFPGKKAMTKHPLGQGQAGGEQHRRPVDGVKAQDVLADHMQTGGPAALAHQLQIRFIAWLQQGGEVAQQGVKPHVKCMAAMAWYPNPPG